MIRNINYNYFEWMVSIVCDKKDSKRLSYRKLFAYLHNIEFTYILGMDGNRAEDGTDLRYRFGYEHNLEGPLIARYLDDQPCSVLEMMIALSIRCEEHIMDNPDIGDRTAQWFWNMIESLGLESMSDSRFDKKHADTVIERFLNRKYKRNGEGGLFTIHHCERDLRSVEIWYQMMWYLDTILEN